MSPTIILVHGAFAESASWDGVIGPLSSAGHEVIAAANPLRGLTADAEFVTDIVRSVEGPVVLAGHSYGGMVITNVPADAGNIVGAVFVCGFAPEPGEDAVTLSGKFPGSTLGDTLNPVPLANGNTDLYIQQDKYHAQFCADVPDEQAAKMKVTQRPVTQEALAEPSGPKSLWNEVPSRFLIGELDKNIPPAAQHFMADRAGSLNTVEIPGAAHAITVSQPGPTADLILEAAG